MEEKLQEEDVPGKTIMTAEDTLHAPKVMKGPILAAIGEDRLKVVDIARIMTMTMKKSSHRMVIAAALLQRIARKVGKERGVVDKLQIGAEEINDLFKGKNMTIVDFL